MGSLLPLGVTVKVYEVADVSPRNEHVWVPVGGVVVLATMHVVVFPFDVTV